ncbi:sulfide:quinone oxidoreductase [Aliiroseovarius halocynthiae]|uniref:NAD(P)/FAD-dependent oxidoreductase n=1 Tax=Aliiroseovarius halocynthiae TaxID=985055 RepID=A0A545SU48_9RHOB|nr:FAD/NAD(P)-binding oxidoreductase [Aliiroseovarius halocynthiae]TQV68486.1 NAD(P)/FAD-dependent oxidoreductase [Aliiroseovarius halocynthiae]SMR70883.1 sulfide:quinone oxidoreductase [Aliiroseovarius halocynthiae]
MTHSLTATRRGFLSFAAGAGALVATGAGTAAAAPTPINTKARIVILGAGAAGTALANRLTRRLNGAEITIIDPRKEHWYQPGFSLIAAGLKPADYSVSQTAHWLPKNITWISERAAEIDPDGNKVTTESGKSIPYDFLVLATGLVLNYSAIEGFEMDMIGKDGIGSLYAGPDYAAKTWEAAGRYTEDGGVGIFTRPATEMKCAGAPIKHTFLIDDIARKAGTTKLDINYMAHNKGLFGVPIISEKLRMLFGQREITPHYSHVLKAVDAGKKVATFATENGDAEMPYDYLHIVPPQQAPDVIRNSALTDPGSWDGRGWATVDKHTLQHTFFDNVFAVGDIAGVPKGKTAASVKWQVPVVEEHLIAQITGSKSDASYNGYTSCPLITRVGRAMLIEFDYDNNLTPSFPGVIAPLEELWISWLMKEVALKATYNAMIRGDA